MKGLPIIIAAIGGALVGAATALLLAPQTGSQTRESIKDFIRTHVPGIKAAELEDLADQICRRNQGYQIKTAHMKRFSAHSFWALQSELPQRLSSLLQPAKNSALASKQFFRNTALSLPTISTNSLI